MIFYKIGVFRLHGSQEGYDPDLAKRKEAEHEQQLKETNEAIKAQRQIAIEAIKKALPK